jgi:hypothetical protein
VGGLTGQGRGRYRQTLSPCRLRYGLKKLYAGIDELARASRECLAPDEGDVQIGRSVCHLAVRQNKLQTGAGDVAFDCGSRD